MHAQSISPDEAAEALAGYILHPNYVLRIGGEAYSGLARLDEGRADACWQDILRLDTALTAEREGLCTQLEQLVPGCVDREITRAILNTKRAVFAGRKVAARDAGQFFAAFADSPVAAELAAHLSQLEELESLRVNFAAAHAEDLLKSGPVIAELAQGTNLRTGMSYSAPALSQSLRSAFSLDREKPLKAKAIRNIEDSAIQYFARCATKTSPLSSFTPIHVGSWAEGSGASTLDLSGTMIRRIEIKGGLIRHVIEPVLQSFEFVRPNLPLKTNGSVRFDDDQLRYEIITPGQEVSGRTWGTGLQVASMAANPIMRYMAVVLAAQSGSAMMADDLVAAVCAKVPSMSVQQILAFVRKLFSIGYLVADDGLIEQADALDWAERIAGLPGFPNQAEAHALIAELRNALAVMEGEQVPAREAAAQEIRRILAELAGLAGADRESALFHQPFYENCYLQQAGQSLDPAMLAPFAADLDLISELSHLLDPNQELHSRLADFYVARFGEDGRCEDTAAFLRDFDRVYSPGVLDGDILAEETAPASPQTQCLLDAKREFDRLLDPLLESQTDVVLDEQALRAIVAMAPNSLRSRKFSYSHVVQFATENGQSRLVLNQVFGGRSSILSRFLEVLEEPAIKRVRDYIRAGSSADLIAELPGVFGFNANRHPPLTDQYLQIAPFPRPDDQRAPVDFATLALVYDKQQHRVVFADEAGRVIDVFYQGLLIPALMPQLHRVLSLSFTEGPSFAIVKSIAQRAMRAGREQATVPRISIGNVVLFRRTVLMHNRLLPNADCAADEFYRAVREWQHLHGLPDRFFMRSLPLIESLTGTEKGKIDWQSVNFKDMKPFFVDLRSPRFVRLLQNMTKRNELAVSISELLPDFGNSPFSINGEERVAELHFEMSMVEPRAEPLLPKWHVVRVAWFEDNREALMNGPIRQVFERLRQEDAVRRVSIMPHWLHGPHVDIAIEALPQAFQNRIYPDIRLMIDRWLSENPSTTVLDPVEYEARSRGIGMFELNPGPYLPLLDNNRVALAPFKAPVGLAIPELAEHRATFLDDALETVFGVLHLKHTDRDNYFRSLGAMLLVTADSYADGMSEGYMSLRSHADYFFAAHDVSGQVRARFDGFDDHWGADFDQMARALADRHWGSLPMTSSAQALVKAWSGVVDRTDQRSRDLVTANHAALISQTVHQDLARTMAAVDDSAMRQRFSTRKISDIGEAFLNSERGLAAQRSPDFLTYRTNVNFFYLLLPTLGVTPVQKFMLCDLVARSVERVFARDWRQSIGMVAAE